jgi:Domain of unknown function (DUF1844)
MEKEESGFKVADRRMFTADGDLRNSEATEPATRDTGIPTFGTAPAAPSKSEEDMPMTFEALIFSLSTSALLQLGLAPHPETGKPEKDLPGAKQTIDILEMLQQKTRGNLTADEGQMLEECLYDLKMTYVKALQASKP